MADYVFTPQAKKLSEALKQRGLNVTTEQWDEHKHVDIAIKDAKIYIEVDGQRHITDPKQIEADFQRDHFSDKANFRTLRIPNIMVDNHLEEIVDAITEVVKTRLSN